MERGAVSPLIGGGKVVGPPRDGLGAWAEPQDWLLTAQIGRASWSAPA